MILFRNENNIGYVAQVTISKTDGVNGEKSNTGIIYFGDEVKNRISRGWSYIFQNEEYVITTHTWNDRDNTVSFTAVQRFFYELSKRSLYESWTGSHTFAAYLNAIFKDTNYTFSNTANVAAFEKDNWGMTDKLTLFNDIIDQANVEFYVSGNTVYILEKVGTDLSTIVRKKFNLDTASIEADNSAFATYGRGYGAYSNPDDTSSNRLMVEYKSPLYDVYYPKFGAIEMAPVDNQNYKIAENLLSAVKAKVDASYTFSLSMTLLDLKQAGYPYEMANAGDYLTVVDEELNFADKVRIIKVVSNYDINGNRVTCEVECGDLSFATQQKTSTATISEIVEGKALIPNSWLSNEITIAANGLLAASTQLVFNDTGIVAIQKGNSNNRVLLNSDGISISTNGGKSFKTAIDAQGIVADQLYGKLIQGINFETRDDSNNFKIELMDGLVKFFDDSKTFGYLSSLNDSAGNAIGIELKNNAGYTLNLGQTDSSGKSTPVFQITPNSTIDSPKYKLFGQLLNNLKANVPSGWLISNKGKINFSANDGINNNLEISENGLTVLGDSNVYNGSNNILQTSNDSLRAIPSYGLTENYIGDIGESKTGDDSEIEIQIEDVYAGLVSTSESYQVFITPYSQAKFWVEERSASKFVVKSDVPGAAFGWEIKAKRKGYEDGRLVQTNI